MKREDRGVGRRRYVISGVVAAGAVLVAATAGIVALGQSVGDAFALGGHSDRTETIRITIGGTALQVPENMVRMPSQRLKNRTGRLQLYMRWPELTGYSSEQAAAFNNREPERSIIFVTVEEALMSRDMSGRLDKVYRPILGDAAIEGPNGLQLRAFQPDAGYIDELLAISGENGEDDTSPFVARCLAGQAGRQALAGCERDVLIGDDLSMTYRFPRELLGAWRDLDPAIVGRIEAMVENVESSSADPIY